MGTDFWEVTGVGVLVKGAHHTAVQRYSGRVFSDQYYEECTVFVAFDKLEPTWLRRGCYACDYELTPLADLPDVEIKRKLKETVGHLPMGATYEYGQVTFRYSF